MARSGTVSSGQRQHLGHYCLVTDVKVRRERRWSPAGAIPARKASMAIGFETGKAALALNPKPAFGFTSAADPEVLPQPEPRAMREHLVVPSIVASRPVVEQLQNAVDATAELPYDSIRCLRSPQIP
jgi:hypothetical protein